MKSDIDGAAAAGARGAAADRSAIGAGGESERSRLRGAGSVGGAGAESERSRLRGRASAEREPSLIRPLAEVTADDFAFAGERGMRLAADRRAGLGDERGFVVGTPAYAALCDGGLLRRRLAVTLADVSVSDCERLMAAASMARSLVTCEPLPSAFVAQLEQAHAGLLHDAPNVAVTVSVSDAEPALPPLAIGPCERFRHVRGVGSVAQAVRHCWSALFDARRVHARAQRGLSQIDVEIAVVVVREGG